MGSYLNRILLLEASLLANYTQQMDFLCLVSRLLTNLKLVSNKNDRSSNLQFQKKERKEINKNIL